MLFYWVCCFGVVQCGTIVARDLINVEHKWASSPPPLFLNHEVAANVCEIDLCVKHLRLFSHESKVRNLNFNSKCAFWFKIRKTVFWTVCTPNYIATRHLKCAFQMTVWRCFQVTHLANHAVKSLYECPDL